MATFELVDGKPGQGKSLYTARKIKWLVRRNTKYFARTGQVRFIYTNMKLTESFEKSATLSNGVCLIKYWRRVNEVTNLRDVDLIWDEIATELDSRNFANLSDDLKEFLSQYRKRGVDIYSNTQDFSMIDMRARLMMTEVKSLRKVIGSRDPTPTKPPVRVIWGFVLVLSVENKNADDPHNKKYFMPPDFFFIDKRDVEIYDTRQDIPRSPPAPMRHIEYQCEYADDPNHVCNHKKIVHS